MGKQWLYPKGKKILIRYGWGWNVSWTHHYNYPDSSSKSNYFYTGVSPSIGASYFITDNILISSGMGLHLQYRGERDINQTYHHYGFSFYTGSGSLGLSFFL